MYKKIEEFIIAALLGCMLFFVLIQIYMRDIFQSGIKGGDEIIRHLVLWVAFLGAARATEEGTHIKIDIASKILPKKLQSITKIIIDFFSATVCLILVYSSLAFILMEYKNCGKLAFLNLNIPLWIAQSIIPLGYAIIALRFIKTGISNFTFKT